MEQNETNKEEDKATNWAEILKHSEDTLAKIQAENKKAQEILSRQEELAARNLLGGSSIAGQPMIKEKKPEITPQEYAAKALKGEL